MYRQEVAFFFWWIMQEVMLVCVGCGAENYFFVSAGLDLSNRKCCWCGSDLYKRKVDAIHKPSKFSKYASKKGDK